MDTKQFLKPTWIKIAITLIIPLTLWYGTVYDFDYSAPEPIGKPNLVYQTWKVYFIPLIVNIPFTIYSWSFKLESQRVVSDNFVLTDTITFIVSILVNYLLACSLIFLYSKIKHRQKSLGDKLKNFPSERCTKF